MEAPQTSPTQLVDKRKPLIDPTIRRIPPVQRWGSVSSQGRQYQIR